MTDNDTQQARIDRVIAKHTASKNALAVADELRAEYLDELFPLLDEDPNLLTTVANAIDVSRQAVFNQMKTLRRRRAATS